MPRTARKTVKAATLSPASVPPIIAALVMFAEPNHDGLPSDFVKAYEAAPALVAALVAGEDGAYHEPIGTISGFTAARDKADAHPELATTQYGPNDPRRDDVTRAIAILNHAHEDLPTELTTPVATAAFYVGIAYASYILTHGGER